MNQEQQYMFDDSLMLHVREFAALQCHLDLHRIFLIYDAKRWKETTGSGKRANAMNDEKKLTLKKKCRGKGTIFDDEDSTDSGDDEPLSQCGSKS